MRKILSILFFFALSVTAQAQPAEALFNDLRSTNWEGSFHFDVFNWSPLGPHKAHTSQEYKIQISFLDELNAQGQIPYMFSKDVSKAKGFDSFVFENIDVQACPNEARLIEVKTEQAGAYSGVVHAPACKNGKRKIKDLTVQKIVRSGDDLRIVLADNAIGKAVTFQVIYNLHKVQK
ncbi:hypothetical protein [Bdellovibrio svalbardensis]|uniref:Uncharacterized protein n=1 Tax=Bdellovibrio svalbardensis TaxID=2972972 RepID=A0ABT6DQ71_9BACT|nr:hypothetical protein [Bdellovibrio svalbardensis]MDG0817293.1 hypothetical protein [Bdellovibrio svalbardensis]